MERILQDNTTLGYMKSIVLGMNSNMRGPILNALRVLVYLRVLADLMYGFGPLHKPIDLLIDVVSIKLMSQFQSNNVDQYQIMV